jgi:thiosulfate/3-mercaptopyruvate sulfurtransferase
VEPWQRVFVDPAFISDDVHSKPGCIGCHGGVPGSINMGDAHVGMVAKPSARPAQVCGSCHVGLVRDARTSVHRMLPDFVAALKARGADFTMPETVKAYTAQCAQCHATCGDCHISRPSVAGGGLVAGHVIQGAALQTETCSACHNATVDAEFTGAHEGIPGDVHAEAGMTCTDCHSAETMHQSQRAASQNSGAACVDCHQDDVKLGGDNVQHTVHVNTVQCQVCHSAGAYTSCFTCHTGNDEDGLPYATIESSALTFKIGRNPSPDGSQPWNYVLVRHAPADPDLWAFYGDDLLPEFDNAPTWHTAAPHNIQKITPQNATCNSCHGQQDLFLTEGDVAPETLEANSGVIVTRVPPARLEVAP